MINPCSILLLLFLLWQIVRGRKAKRIYINLFSITSFVELMIERGYFIQIGSQQIAYRTICEAILFIASFAIMFQNKIIIKKELAKNIATVLLLLIIGWALLILYPSKATGANMDVSWDEILVGGFSRQPIVFTKGMIVEIIQILIFLIVLLVAYSTISKEEWMIILSKVTRWSQLVVIVGILELLINLLTKRPVYYTIVDAIFGKSSATVSNLRIRGNLSTLCGLTKESSHYVFALSIFLIINMASYSSGCYRRKKDYYIFQAMTIILIVFSMSFSSIYFLSAFTLLVFLLYEEKKGHASTKLIAISISSLIALIILLNNLLVVANKLGKSSFLGRRVYSIVEELGNISSNKWLYVTTALEWSNRVRLGSTYETFKLIRYRPILGLGFASVSAHSSMAMLLVGMGLLGTFFYFKMILFARKVIFFSHNSVIFVTCFIVYLLMNIFNSLGLRPFYETWLLLLMMSFLILASDDKPISN